MEVFGILLGDKMGLNTLTIKLLKNIVIHCNINGSILTYGVQNTAGNYSHQDVFFKSLGLSVVDSVDVYNSENPTYVADLGNNISGKILRRYDLIFDGGTMEHCFNVPSVLSNTVRLLKIGGYIVHLNPLNNWIGHSFYQFSPTLYYDFYYDNGFNDMNSWIYFRKGDDIGELKAIKRTDKIRNLKKYNNEILIIFAAKKMYDYDEIRYPIQEKYRKQKRNWEDVLCDTWSQVVVDL